MDKTTDSDRYLGNMRLDPGAIDRYLVNAWGESNDQKGLKTVILCAKTGFKTQ